jgi:hypothetical protein
MTVSEWWPRAGLIFLGASNVVVGLWAQLAPKSFYDDFPGFGRHWVRVDGPYNEHLVRDVGGLNLALAVVTLAAAATLLPLLVRVAAVAWLVYGVPHFLYHLANLDPLPGGDQAGEVVSLAVGVLIPVALLLAPLRRVEPVSPPP